MNSNYLTAITLSYNKQNLQITILIESLFINNDLLIV
jgi:hypothetical protein